jgi:hypothetical protein
MGALVVFSIRSHRVDDYRGRYRIWLWAVAALVWASLDAATGVHASLNDGLAALSGMDRAGLGSLLWLAVYGLVFGGLGVRLSCELWPSLEAFGALAVAAMLYVGSAVCHFGLVQFDSLLLGTVVGTLATLLAHGALVYSIGLFARHVHLDAQGRLLVDAQPAKKKSRSRAKLSVVAADDADEKPRKKSAAKNSGDEQDKEPTKTASGNTVGAAISAAASKPAIAKPTLAAVTDADDEDDSDEEMYDDNGNKLSKSERRRLKKMARREQQRRAA